jgi:type III pantothenate kinase
MLLCIDIGNSNIKLGLFDKNDMVMHWRIATNRSSLPDEYAVLLLNLFEIDRIKKDEIKGCAISSVAPPLTEVFVELSRQYLKLEPIMFETSMDIGMKINTDYPNEVGSDLIMNALAAREMYNSAVIVVGFGTATTFTAVSAAGNVEGVAIAPGILTSTQTLFQTASTLPLVALKNPESAIGKNTIESIRAGIVYGFVGLTEKLIEKMKNELGGDPHVVATGGLASLIATETDVFDVVEPNLALIGLRILVDLTDVSKSPE